ncbi:MAG: HNH endonuclease [Luteolibacter sp.]
MKITGRSSSITNAFINSIIPVIQPTEDEVRQALGILGMEPTNLRCSYCGDQSSEWDHLNPLVKNKKPTGYVSEIANLVPACGKCNQSKGNKEWKVWMLSAASLSPKSKGIPNLEKRVQKIEEYERTFHPTTHDFEAMVGESLWSKHWENWQRIIDEMKDAQVVATEINAKIRIANKMLR